MCVSRLTENPTMLRGKMSVNFVHYFNKIGIVACHCLIIKKMFWYNIDLILKHTCMNHTLILLSNNVSLQSVVHFSV